MTRPKKEIDWDEVDNFLEAGCIGTVIAAHFDMHPDTFYRRIEEKYKMGFTAYSSLMNQYGEALLKKAQFDKAIGRTKKGDATLLTFLGKVRLKQKENEEGTVPEDINQRFVDMMSQILSLQSSERKIEDNNNISEQKS